MRQRVRRQADQAGAFLRLRTCTLYKDRAGRFGLQSTRQCPHRGADLSCGAVAGAAHRRLRCFDHGWQVRRARRSAWSSPTSDIANRPIRKAATAAPISTAPSRSMRATPACCGPLCGPLPAPELPVCEPFAYRRTASARCGSIRRYPATGFQRQENSIDNRQYDRAIEDCNEAIWLERESAQAFGDRGAAYYFKGDYDAFEHGLHLPLKLDPRGRRPRPIPAGRSRSSDVAARWPTRRSYLARSAIHAISTIAGCLVGRRATTTRAIAWFFDARAAAAAGEPYLQPIVATPG